jgi:hypothetical protein
MDFETYWTNRIGALDRMETIRYWLAHYRVPFEAQQLVTQLANQGDIFISSGSQRLEPAACIALYDELVALLPSCLRPSEYQIGLIRRTLLEGYYFEGDEDPVVVDFDKGFGWGLLSLAERLRIRSNRFFIYGYRTVVYPEEVGLPDSEDEQSVTLGRLWVADGSIFSSNLSSERKKAVIDLLSSFLEQFKGEGLWYSSEDGEEIGFMNIAEDQLGTAVSAAAEAYPKILLATEKVMNSDLQQA